MTQTNIYFNDKNYLVDDTYLSSATNELKACLTNTINGSGAVIKFGEVEYNVDSTKLTNTTNDFISYLGTVAGEGYNVTVNGVQYSVDSAKMQNAVVELEAVLSDLQSGNIPSSPTARKNEYGFYYDAKYSFCSFPSRYVHSCYFRENGTVDVYGDGTYSSTKNVSYSENLITYEDGTTLTVSNDGQHLRNSNNAYVLGDCIMETEDYTYYFYGDYYLFNWSVYPKDTTKTKYEAFKPISEYKGYPLSLKQTFRNCANLIIAPKIPSNVINMAETFRYCSNLTTLTSEIPSGVKNMGDAFYHCKNLTGTIVINADPSSYDRCFEGTIKPITITGSCSDETKAALAATASGNVTY